MSSVSFIYDGKNQSLEGVSTYFDIAQTLTRGHHQFLVAEVDGKLTDLTTPIEKENFNLKFYGFDSPQGQEVFWHTGAHILAQAILRLFPGTLYSIGPAIDKGFYYDFDLGDRVFLPEDMEKIESEVQKIVEENHSVLRKEVSKKEALSIFQGNLYKTEIIEQLPEDAVITVYSQGDFTDLCRGPHLSRTGLLKAFKVMSFAGAYWRGDSKNRQLQRVYATAYPESKQLNAYLRFLEEAKKRDHRKIGKELDLFSFHEEGPGFPFWHPKGTAVFEALVDYMRKENSKRGYAEIKTPPILNDILWKRSGHWNNYQKNMYFTEIDERSFAVKPMNCPGGMLVFNTRLHSYRELPIKQAEFGLVHRHELSGVLHGLFRVRSFTQDDAHVFCSEEQLEDQILEIMEYILEVYRSFGFQDISLFIATRPENSIGSDEQWDLSTRALKNVLQRLELPFKIKEGEGAFYGPKIEVNIKDCLDRNWQLGTVQVDYSMPERFDINYDGADGKKHRPIMLHRAILGSLERFIGILVEHYEGKLPLWIAPVQIKVVSISEAHVAYCQEVEKELKDLGFRVESDHRAETLGYKVKEARNQRIPYIVVAGDKECSEGTLSVRDRKNQSVTLTRKEFLSLLEEKRNSRAAD